MPEKYVPAYEGEGDEVKPKLTPEEVADKNKEKEAREGVAINARNRQLESERKKREENFPKSRKRKSEKGPDDQTLLNLGE